jgi:hypothetical protein
MKISINEKTNFYWSTYKDLENEFLKISDNIHINDEQLLVYSRKISDLLVRAAIEIESISKKLYGIHSGKIDTENIYFDTDCLSFLNDHWDICSKKITISSQNIFLEKLENIQIKPLYKANKRGASGSKWKIAYQAVKHDRYNSLKCGNLKNLISSIGALFILNLYLKETTYFLGKDKTGDGFNNHCGSSIFSVSLHINTTSTTSNKYHKNADYSECIYLLKPTEKSSESIIKSLKNMQQLILEKRVKQSGLEKFIIENSSDLIKSSESMTYEAVLNKNQDQ